MHITFIIVCDVNSNKTFILFFGVASRLFVFFFRIRRIEGWVVVKKVFSFSFGAIGSKPNLRGN